MQHTPARRRSRCSASATQVRAGGWGRQIWHRCPAQCWCPRLQPIPPAGPAVLPPTRHPLVAATACGSGTLRWYKLGSGNSVHDTYLFKFVTPFSATPCLTHQGLTLPYRAETTQQIHLQPGARALCRYPTCCLTRFARFKSLPGLLSPEAAGAVGVKVPQGAAVATLLGCAPTIGRASYDMLA